jgi:hypothetical protein
MNEQPANTLGIPTSFSIGLDVNTMIFLGAVVAVFVFHKVITK